LTCLLTFTLVLLRASPSGCFRRPTFSDLAADLAPHATIKEERDLDLVLGAVLARASDAAAHVPMPPPRAAIRSGRGAAQETSFGLSGPVDLNGGGVVDSEPEEAGYETPSTPTVLKASKLNLYHGGGKINETSITAAAGRPHLDVQSNSQEEADYLVPVRAAPAAEQEGDYLVPVRSSASVAAVGQDVDCLASVRSPVAVATRQAASFAAMAARGSSVVVDQHAAGAGVCVGNSAGVVSVVAARQHTAVNIDMGEADMMFTI
jgi:hypothetical protein